MGPFERWTREGGRGRAGGRAGRDAEGASDLGHRNRRGEHAVQTSGPHVHQQAGRAENLHNDGRRSRWEGTKLAVMLCWLGPAAPVAVGACCQYVEDALTRTSEDSACTSSFLETISTGCP
ncbi:hypothetical protein Mp_1g09740 [Marchantia polymorpha subsp. ruderalis]|uniref:Uncharacterized protein n=2 Tax=Marchantia polymorpha TaxID=3197 RepID=A0AAF6AND4_MARPO|nr:hypothetical protein MARPO_0096s0027 [Marchantia polymorpha]PTQ32677.1 hypothetical protein MARPO_0096s0027 [Marchantia polymorpha]BBM97953.1 hypothetical protein Mp_1g09740 [Marchantia polymorpha subsp. ruderalis]BBM97954.1 hypothetical protein Mp_1g09740 [Marchantia polymorpha subsp. ruderalis]|eukprot:PTQ32675.1 hypothetical protein MARPO_0096s0027 [Marchantia polymorpha]